MLNILVKICPKARLKQQIDVATIDVKVVKLNDVGMIQERLNLELSDELLDVELSDFSLRDDF